MADADAAAPASPLYVPPMSAPAAPAAPEPAQRIGPAAPANSRGPSPVNPRSVGYRSEPDWRDSLPRAYGAPPRADPSAEPATTDSPRAAAAPGGEGPIKIGDEELSAAEVNELRAEIAARKSRELTLPQSPDAYRDELPSTFQVPEGLNFTLDTRDPLLAQYKALAFEERFSQQTYSKGLAMIAGMRCNEAQAIAAAKAREVARLGPAAQARVDSVVQFLKSTGGPASAALVNTIKLYPLASVIEAYENMAQSFRQSTGRFSQAHRATPPSDRKIEGYERMTYSERRFAQDQMRGKR